jgi:Protein of unknown function (DUF3761)
MRTPFMFGLLIASALATTAAPAIAQTKVKASAQSICKDGTTSNASGSGACSSHGGVDSVATAAARASKKAAKADVKAKTADSSHASGAASKARRADAKAVKAEDKAAKDSTGATAQCKDGTYSHAKTTQGACSGHGGIAKTLKS